MDSSSTFHPTTKGEEEVMPPARVVSSVRYPETHMLTKLEIFNKRDKSPRIEVLRNHLLNEGRLEKDAAIHIVSKATRLFRTEENVIKLHSPITICGDIHGQFYDLIKLFEVGGSPESTNYLFLGDYVDRGQFGVECIIYLYALKIAHPNSFHLLRGNHECRHLTSYFTFKEECNIKYGSDLYDCIMESFDALPLAALVNRQFLCVHGGISPEIVSIADIMEINRFCEPPSQGPMCDLLWSDPSEQYDDHDNTELFTHNGNRGCSYFFTYAAVSEFNAVNNLLCVVRAHEAQNNGFRMYRKNPKNGFPSLITIFSAPNYLDVYNNKAAILKYENNVINIKQFNSVAHPYWLPNFMDVFTWSLPFVAEKLTNILMTLINICSDEELSEDPLNRVRERRAAIRAKVRAIGTLASTYTAIRRENESVVSLKGLTPPRRPNTEAIIKLHDSLVSTESSHKFDVVRRLDRAYERMPPPVDATAETNNNGVEKNFEKAANMK